MNPEKAQIPAKFRDAQTEWPIASYFLCGEVGTGKTYTAAALALKADGYVSFRSSFSLFNQLREYDPRDPNDYSKAIIENADFLVIDDVGKEKMTDWKFEQLFGLINHRYENELTTTITSNFTLSELAVLWGDDINGQAIVSRIAEMCDVVLLDGIDRRQP
jgi:DNA replication protein DnaC